MGEDADTETDREVEQLRRELEREREERRRLERFVRHTADGIILHDLDGKILDVTRPASELLGRPVDDLVGMNLEEVTDPFDRDVARETWKDVLRGETRTFETEMIRRDDSTFPVEVELQPYEDDRRDLILGVVRDITHRRRTESMLQAREEMYRVVFRESLEAIYVADAEAGRIMEANSSFCELLGYEGPEAIGLRLDEFVVDDTDSIGEYVRELREGASISNLERTWRRRDGEEVQVQVTASGLQIPESGREVFFVVARDVTEEKELQTRMVQMDRMIAMGTLAAGVGHEINNPLSYVLANVEFGERVLDEHTDDERLPEEVADDLEGVQEALDEAEEGARRIDDIVVDLKTLAASDEDQELEPIPIDRVLTSSVNIVWNEIRNRAQFERRIEDVPPVLATESRLGQVFVNLLMNAAQAIPPGEADDNEIRVEAFRRDDSVVVEVTDTGRGIPPEEIEHIFDPFFTTKDESEGTGLGLAISRRIVDSLGGTIDVESDPGDYTTFTVELEAAQGEGLHAASSVVETGIPGALEIVVIDSDEQFGPAVDRLLGDEHSVAYESRWPDAKARLQTNDPPDAVLCDAGMPNATAPEIYQWFKRQAPELLPRVVFLTAEAQSERTERLLERISNPSIPKPLDRRDLEESLQSVLGP